MTLRFKWIARLFLLTYIILSTGSANASFLCQSVNASSHLEFNPAGQCVTVCHPEAGNLVRDRRPFKASTNLASPVDGCYDSAIVLSAIPSLNQFKQRSKLAAIDIGLSKSRLTFTKALGLPEASGLSTDVQLPRPQALASLRSVILLH